MTMSKRVEFANLAWHDLDWPHLMTWQRESESDHSGSFYAVICTARRSISRSSSRPEFPYIDRFSGERQFINRPTTEAVSVTSSRVPSPISLSTPGDADANAFPFRVVRPLITVQRTFCSATEVVKYFTRSTSVACVGFQFEFIYRFIHWPHVTPGLVDLRVRLICCWFGDRRQTSVGCLHAKTWHLLHGLYTRYVYLASTSWTRYNRSFFDV